MTQIHVASEKRHALRIDCITHGTHGSITDLLIEGVTPARSRVVIDFAGGILTVFRDWTLVLPARPAAALADDAMVLDPTEVISDSDL